MIKVFGGIINQIKGKVQDCNSFFFRSEKVRDDVFQCFRDLKDINFGDTNKKYLELPDKNQLQFITNERFDKMTSCAQQLGQGDVTSDSLKAMCQEVFENNSDKANLQAALILNLCRHSYDQDIIKQKLDDLNKIRKIAEEAQDFSNPNAAALLKFVAYATCSKAETYLEAPAVKCLAENDYVDAFLEWLH